MTQKTQNVLFLVTGMTPAIITETVWALACDPELDEESRWIPDRVEVLSTEHGLNQIRSHLLASKVLEQFKTDFSQIAHMVFDESCMHSIRDNDTKQTGLLDLKTPEHNERAADQINERIRQLTADEHTSVHVSIAGGRKTMGFYAGYALSLHGRAQDRMSHVLVDETYENIQNFFYPTPVTRYVTDRNHHALDASKAQVWLADIPFVRMKDAIHQKHQLKSDDSFSEVVSKIKNSFSPATLTINLDTGTAMFNEMEVSLPPREFAFLHWFADMRLQNSEGVCCPRANNTDKRVNEADQEHIGMLTNQFQDYYSEQKSAEVKDFSVDKRMFNSTVSHIKTHLTQQLGLETAAKFSITNGGKRGAPFFLDIPPESITLIDTMS